MAVLDENNDDEVNRMKKKEHPPDNVIIVANLWTRLRLRKCYSPCSGKTVVACILYTIMEVDVKSGM